jgi:ATP-binding cassette, subfamily B (MDR/TAP), member 1
MNKTSESEQMVQTALDNLLSSSENITTVVIAHRLQTVRNADVIAVIQEGRVVEVGNHTSLLNLEKGYYKTMISKSRGDDLMVDS